MSYEYLEDIATADVAFKAWGKTREELFSDCARAMMKVMVENLEIISAKEKRTIKLKEETPEMLLFQFLQELIYYKDAQGLLLRVKKIKISQQDHHSALSAEACGEIIDAERHHLNTDVKAVTLHRFSVAEIQKGWEATVVLDV